MMSLFAEFLGVGSRVYLMVALLLCLFWVLILRPERIRGGLLFKLACLALALGIAAPSVGILILGENAGVDWLFSAEGRNESAYSLIRLITAIEQVLLASGFFLAAASLMPGNSARAPGDGDEST